MGSRDRHLRHSRAYKGITLFADQSLSASAKVQLTGGSATRIFGTIYAPTTQMTVSGESDNNDSQVIASTLTVSGGSTVGIGNGHNEGGFTSLASLSPNHDYFKLCSARKESKRA
jgi:hypothetical protein